MSYVRGLGITMIPGNTGIVPYGSTLPYVSQTGGTEAEDTAAFCRYQPCGSAACPCPPTTPTPTRPGVQTLPDLVTTGVRSYWPLALLVVGILALGKAKGGRLW